MTGTYLPDSMEGRSCFVPTKGIKPWDRKCSSCTHYLTRQCKHLDDFGDEIDAFDSSG